MSDPAALDPRDVARRGLEPAEMGVATAEGKLTDAAGKLSAHGTTTCLIVPA